MWVRQGVRVSADEQEIRNLLGRYCERQDAADFEGVAELFRYATYGVEGGAIAHGFGELLAAKRSHTRVHDDGSPRTNHLVLNTIIKFGPDGSSALARSYWLVLQATERLPLQVIATGRYRDAFAKVDGAWRFTERRIQMGLIGDLGDHVLGQI
jgi:hypothetical protein